MSIRTESEMRFSFLCVPVAKTAFVRHANGPADLLGRCYTGHIGRSTFDACRTSPLIEAAQRFRFVLINIEYGEELGNHQQVLNLISEIQ